MTYSEIWHRIATSYEDGEARAIARILIEELFGLSYTDIVCGATDQLSADDTLRLDTAVRRIEQGEPLQHVLGYADFCGNHFGVNASVLIPRPETEWLVDEGERLINGVSNAAPPAPKRILDIGTGSGCIAICLAKEMENKAYVEAWDISEEALAVAKENADLHDVQVIFKKRDILKFMPETAFDLIVSNPPYITDDERKDMEAHVLDYEPHTALFVQNDDPLLFYRALAKLAKEWLAPEGMIAVETNRMFADDVARLFEENGLEETQTITDCFGNKRFAVGRNILL